MRGSNGNGISCTEERAKMLEDMTTLPLGVDLGGSKIRTAVVNSRGEVL